MPISPEKAKNYPGGSIRSKEWKAFRASILERAGHCCEGTPQHPDCRALCQRCHNKWDAPYRQANARKTRRNNPPQIDIENYLKEEQHGCL